MFDVCKQLTIDDLFINKIIHWLYFYFLFQYLRPTFLGRFPIRRGPDMRRCTVDSCRRNICRRHIEMYTRWENEAKFALPPFMENNFELFTSAAINQPLIIIDRHPSNAGANSDTFSRSLAGATSEIERWFNQNLQAHKWGKNFLASSTWCVRCEWWFVWIFWHVVDCGWWTKYLRHFQFSSFPWTSPTVMMDVT